MIMFICLRENFSPHKTHERQAAVNTDPHTRSGLMEVCEAIFLAGMDFLGWPANVWKTAVTLKLWLLWSHKHENPIIQIWLLAWSTKQTTIQGSICYRIFYFCKVKFLFPWVLTASLTYPGLLRFCALNWTALPFLDLLSSTWIPSNMMCDAWFTHLFKLSIAHSCFWLAYKSPAKLVNFLWCNFIRSK